MKITLRCFLMIFAALSLVGCGLKGPLYIPDQKAPVEGTTAKTPAQSARQ